MKRTLMLFLLALLISPVFGQSNPIDEMFDNLHLWTFDCAEYLQVAQWYAQRHTMGAESFDAKMTGLGGLTLRPHGSTGIMTKESYFYDEHS